MRNVTEKLSERFDDLEDVVGVAGAIILFVLIALFAIASPFLWAWVYQMVWNYGIVWLVARLGGSVPTIGYWVGMGLWIFVRFIRHIFTVKVDREK